MVENFFKNTLSAVEKVEDVTDAVTPFVPHCKMKKSHTLVEGKIKIL